MSFTGDLEHLPIVDVIQLLNATRKSGILSVRGRKGESQLVFKDGFIVSASHLNNTLRIGEVLVERGAITRESLGPALEVQKSGGSERKPIIGILLEMGMVEEKDAYAGLQALIEVTIVEMLTWKKGTFVLEPYLQKAPDAYQYCPGNITREINVDAQGVLMDALRIFDEKVRDGELTLEEDEEEPEITADDLGLADLDQLDRKIPGVFSTLDDRKIAAGGEAAAADNPVRRLNTFIARLPQLRTPPELALAQLRYLGEIFARVLTLVVREGELVAEKGIGIKAPKTEGVSGPCGFRLPLRGGSVFSEAVETGRLYCGPGEDTVLREQLYSRIGAPIASRVLLLPVRRFDKTVFLTFADFGAQPEDEVPVELLDMLAGQTGQALERLGRGRSE